jgi:uncharacterized protein YgiM (DUF1202 family)
MAGFTIRGNVAAGCYYSVSRLVRYTFLAHLEQTGWNQVRYGINKSGFIKSTAPRTKILNIS